MVKTPLFGAALLVVVLACVGGVVAQDGESVGAYVPCLPTGANTDVIKGERAYMCITWNNRTRALFTVNADEYAMLDLQNCERCIPLHRARHCPLRHPLCRLVNLICMMLG